MKRAIHVIFLMFSFGHVALAQDTTWLIVEHPLLSKKDDGFDAPIAFATKVEVEKYLQQYLEPYQQEGYLTATWNFNKQDADTLYATILPGKKVYWATLNTTNVDEFALAGVGYRKKDIEGNVFNHQEVVGLMQKMLTYSESVGYPFATVQLDSIIWGDSVISADLIYRKNQYIVFDTILVVGNLNVSANYLIQYTGITPGAPFNQQLLNTLENRLKEIPFATKSKNTKIEFSGNRAKIIMYLDEKQSSTFDFLIGVIPNEAITGRLIITGEGRLQLHNVFNAGELFNFHFSKLESTSKELQTSLVYPYLPKLPIGLEGAFSLYLKDSTFLERTTSAGVLFQMTGNNYFKALANFYNSAVLAIDTGYILSNLQLPPSLDMVERAYGLEWNYEKLNYRFNPYKGYAFTIGATIGNKTIKENASIVELQDPLNPEYDFSTLYDSIDLKSLSVKYHYQLGWYIPLFSRVTLLLQTRGAAIINNYLLQNELYRIGGTTLLRGFDEQSIVVSQYHIGTFELRYLLSQNAYASIFADGGYTENAAGAVLTADWPYGFGAGINFETKAGIFGLTYALGSREGNPVQFKNTKIHFGYVNYF
ncbi:MAG: BamA/TamA family outer membrane protein [Chitinophagaceae bacterium]